MTPQKLYHCFSSNKKGGKLYNILLIQLLKMIQAFERLSLTSTQYYSQISTNQFSQRLIDRPLFTKIDSLVIYNFKSFQGKVYVGPFLQFTSIIGPNGAGKSNILDALMFCFCNQINRMQFYDIRQFIHRDGQQTYEKMVAKNKHCSVEVTFLLQDNSRFCLKRTLFPNSNQVFHIDGEEYSQKVYESYLIKCNINYISSNYAIWQGQIDKIILKTPKELTSYIQTISGSLFFKKDQESKQSLLKQAEKSLELKAQKLLKLKHQKKKIKKSHQNKESSLNLQKEYQQILNKILLIKMYFSNKEIKQIEKQIQLKQKQQKEKIKQINETKLRLQSQENNKRNIQENMDKVKKEIGQFNIQLKNIQNNTNIIDVQTLKQLQHNLQNLKRYKNSLEIKFGQKQKQNLEIQSIDINKEYLELYGKWQKDNESMNKELSKRKQEYLYVQGLIQSKKIIIQEYEQKQLKNEKNHEISQKLKKQLESNIEQIQKNINKLKIQKSKIRQESQHGKIKIQELTKEVNTNNQKIMELESIISDSVQNEHDKELVHKLKNIEGFKGIVQQWVKPASKKYQICFQIMMGKILKYLLCLDQVSSKHIGIKLRENGQIRNLVILNNIPSSKNESNKHELVRNDIGKLGNLAIDAIQYDKNIHNFQLFLKDFLSNKVICQNLSKAWQILGKRIKGIKQIYTLDGNILRTDGIVSSFGSLQSIKTKYKYLDIIKNKPTIMENIQKYQKEKKKIQDQLDILKRKFTDESMLKHNLQIQKLQSRKQQLSQKLSFLRQNNPKKQLKIPKGLQNQLLQLKNRSNKLQIDIKDVESNMMNNKIFKDFVHKNKINNLQSFRLLQNIGSLESIMKLKNNLNKQRQEIQNELKKISVSLVQKVAKYQKLNEKVQSIKGYDEKQIIIKNLREKQNQLTHYRQIYTKMSNINFEKLNFKSEIPSLKIKLSLLKQKTERSIKDEVHLLGLNEIPNETHYNSLQEHLGTNIDRASTRNIQQTNQSLQKQKLHLQQQIQKLSLDMNHTNQDNNHQDIDHQIAQITKDISKDEEEIGRLKEQLDIVKKNRKELFVQFVNDLKPILRETYAILTQNSDGVPGKIDLYMQNEEFPCDDGIYYYPTPPTKRFVYDLDQLSGGQKSIASLALQYSIAMTSKSIFLMLDQIDAFLDKSNVDRFIKLIKSSIKYKSLQFILITHKKSLFLNGQSLVGITKPLMDPFSKAYSLKLEEDQEEESSKTSKASKALSK